MSNTETQFRNNNGTIEKVVYTYSDSGGHPISQEVLVPTQEELDSLKPETKKIDPISILNSLTDSGFSEVVAAIRIDPVFNMFFSRPELQANKKSVTRILAVINASSLTDSTKSELISILSNIQQQLK